MKFEQYKFKFYLNANHAIQINGHTGQVHPHTWEISIVTIKLNDNFVRFNDIETVVDKMFDQYQDKFMNEIEPFNMINPTLENISEVFKDKVNDILKNSGWKLLQIEVSETPARSYVISLSDFDEFMPQAPNTAGMDSVDKEKMITDIINEINHSKTN
nr:6-carboxytetrahydropterin synthase [uncultured Caproiciproducens sp.]